MSTTQVIYAYRKPDEKWEKYKGVYNACQTAGLPVPGEVESYFKGENPNTIGGVPVEISEFISEYSFPGECGVEIDIKNIPKDVTAIRFGTSY